MSTNFAAVATRPQPYRVDSPVNRIQTIDADGDTKYLFRHDFLRLDASNVSILLDREKNTKRVTEKMTKGRSRFKLSAEDADKAFYCALVTGGGWRPYGLEPYTDKGLIPPSMIDFYAENVPEGRWEPTWKELDKPTMCSLTPEKMTEAIDRWLLSKGKSEAIGSIDFMFEKGGIMNISLAIGDFDSPAYKLMFQMRRPDSKRRNRFKEDFAYGVDHSKGELGKTEMVIDLRQGISFFDEYFSTVSDLPDYSQVIFEDKRNVAVGETEDPNRKLLFRPYTDELRSDFLALFNPHFKVEIAAATVQAFARTDQE
jgi:hypothetical protein